MHHFWTARLATPFARRHIPPGGWRRTSTSPTGSGPEGSSPNDRCTGRSSASLCRTPAQRAPRGRRTGAGSPYPPALWGRLCRTERLSGGMGKVFRFFAVLAAALPFLLGSVAASQSAHCPHEHGSSQDAVDCPCCDRMNVATTVPCPICIFGVAADHPAVLIRLDARGVSFAWLDERARGRAIEPPLPPPRLMDLA